MAWKEERHKQGTISCEENLHCLAYSSYCRFLDTFHLNEIITVKYLYETS